jgi:hypothetical protein
MSRPVYNPARKMFKSFLQLEHISEYVSPHSYLYWSKARGDVIMYHQSGFELDNSKLNYLRRHPRGRAICGKELTEYEKDQGPLDGNHIDSKLMGIIESCLRSQGAGRAASPDSSSMHETDESSDDSLSDVSDSDSSGGGGGGGGDDDDGGGGGDDNDPDIVAMHEVLPEPPGNALALMPARAQVPVFEAAAGEKCAACARPFLVVPLARSPEELLDDGIACFEQALALQHSLADPSDKSTGILDRKELFMAKFETVRALEKIKMVDYMTAELKLINSNTVARRKVLDNMPAFVCPINGDLMDDPVTTDDGSTYSRVGIQSWIDKCVEDGNDITSPLTQAIISIRLVDNRSFRDAVSDFMKYCKVF